MLGQHAMVIACIFGWKTSPDASHSLSEHLSFTTPFNTVVDSEARESLPPRGLNGYLPAVVLEISDAKESEGRPSPKKPPMGSGPSPSPPSSHRTLPPPRSDPSGSSACVFDDSDEEGCSSDEEYELAPLPEESMSRSPTPPPVTLLEALKSLEQAEEYDVYDAMLQQLPSSIQQHGASPMSAVLVCCPSISHTLLCYSACCIR